MERITTAQIAEAVSQETGHYISYRLEWGGAYCHYVDDGDPSGGGYFPLYLPDNGSPAKMSMCGMIMCGECATLDEVRQAVHYTLD